MFLQRQISVSLVEGEKESLADGYKFPYKLVDVLPKYVLRLGEGKVTSGYLSLAATESSSLQLPASYDVERPLSCIIRSTLRCKVVVVSPTHGSSTFLIKSTNDADDGYHYGFIMWQGDVTSITVSVPAGFNTALVDYFFWEVPDLDEPTSWQMGARAIGYVSE